MSETTKSNHEIQVEQAAKRFLEYDQTHMIERFALPHTDETIAVTFFSAEYLINRSTGVITRALDGSAAGFREALSIYDLLCYSKEGAALSGQWAPLSSLHSNVAITHSNSLLSFSSTNFSGHILELRAACEQLGGIPFAKSDAGYCFAAFDCLPIVFQFWEGDDDFPSRMSVLFDSNTLDFIHYETGWYIAGQLLSLIEGAMNIKQE